MERIPKPGEFYRHFKDKLYQIVAIAKHSETGELMVVYQALYGDFGVYVRPLSMFVSEVDHEKYPKAAQKYRFERVEPAADGTWMGSQGPETKTREMVWTGAAPEQNGASAGCGADFQSAKLTQEKKKRPLSPLVMPFVEADSYEQKLEILSAMRGKIGQEEMDVLYLSLDLPKRGGTVDAQLDALEKYLQMQLHFDGKRLR